MGLFMSLISRAIPPGKPIDFGPFIYRGYIFHPHVYNWIRGPHTLCRGVIFLPQEARWNHLRIGQLLR